jgi:hypothetical protein
MRDSPIFQHNSFAETREIIHFNLQISKKKSGNEKCALHKPINREKSAGRGVKDFQMQN